ncbi:hypothetical protein MHB44_12065 [Lysinibacillus sp. FSL H8-0500]|uniref:hypothetical protein n=1 Tax=Lysinibacillus sp. FSL H8-0500 TaxID=2921393 RepID=UPI003101A7B9
MKKILFALLLSVVVVGAIFIVYLKSNPPLVMQSYMKMQDNTAVTLITLDNQGLREIKLKQLLVNDKLPEHVGLVISKSEPFEVDTKLEESSEMSLHKLTQVAMLPRQYIDPQAIGKPQHYAIQVIAPDIKKITIQYEYLNLPFTLTAELHSDQ